MNFGFNSNVRSGKSVYHVQSEDRGAAHPYLDTVVYESGRVIYKRSSSYQDFVSNAKEGDLSKQLHERLAQQHREVIAELEAGTLSLNAESKIPEPAAAVKDGLDVRLNNPKTWFASGRATLEIELRERSTGREIGEANVEAFLERDRNRIPCLRARADASGRATLKFPMPSAPAEGTALVIRASDGSLYGELRFMLKAKSSNPAPVPAAK
jgi:hypothetical protein